MENFAVLLLIVGAVIGVGAGFAMLVQIFKTSVGWGVASMLIPFVSLIWLVLHWEEGKRAFMWQLLGGILIGVGVGMAPTP